MGYGDVHRRRGASVLCNHGSTKISNLHIRKLKWHGCINRYVFISILNLLTLSGRFRVGVGVGHISNTIEH